MLTAKISKTVQISDWDSKGAISSKSHQGVISRKSLKKWHYGIKGDMLKKQNYAFSENVGVLLPQIKLYYLLNTMCL